MTPQLQSYTPAPTRYDVRDDWFRRCGRSGLKLPAISLGCWHNFGAAGTDSRHLPETDFHENARRMLFAAFDHGVTHFDLANNYGPEPGDAESRVGRILRDDFAGHRDELIISTKAGYLMWPGPYGEWGSRKYLIASLDQSLIRLGLDYVDIFYSHRPDPETPLEETLFALDLAVRHGKALYTGISSYSGAETEAVTRCCAENGWIAPIIHQPRYNMLDRQVERDLLPVTSRDGLGTIAFCPLAQGVLTDKYLAGIPDDSRARNDASEFLDESALTDPLVRSLGALASIASERSQSVAQLALAWTLRDQPGGPITSALIGASRPEQIIENVRALDAGPFSEDHASRIEQALAEIAPII